MKCPACGFDSLIVIESFCGGCVAHGWRSPAPPGGFRNTPTIDSAAPVASL